MEQLLANPVFSALQGGNRAFCLGDDFVKFFPKEVSPFLSVREFNADAFDEIQKWIEPKRTILLAHRHPIEIPEHWLLKFQIIGTQFVYPAPNFQDVDISLIQKLNITHVEEMIELTRLTKPGPFDERTIEFGNYEGIFSDGKLVAMAGWRMQFENYLEISAVCSHPDYVGKGYARTLLQSQINSILLQNKIPFLHSRADNTRAIDLYEGLGFVANGPMHFYFVQRPSLEG